MASAPRGEGLPILALVGVNVSLSHVWGIQKGRCCRRGWVHMIALVPLIATAATGFAAVLGGKLAF